MSPRARGQGWHRVLRVWVRSTSKHPPSAGGGSTEKRSWKLGKKKTVRSARLSCARRIPFSPPIFPRNGSKLHQAPLPSGSGGGCAGRRPAPCSARAQPLLTPLLAEPPLGSSCTFLCPQPFWMHLHLPWHHQAVHKDEVLVEQQRDVVPAAPHHAGALHPQRGQAAPSPRAEAPRDACTPAAPSPGGARLLLPGPGTRRCWLAARSWRGGRKKRLETSPERPRRGDVAPEACACAGASRGAAASWLPPSPGCACARAEVAK